MELSFIVYFIGKIYAFISVVEGFGTLLLGSPLFTSVYDMTIIHDFSNCIFLLSSVLFCIYSSFIYVSVQ